MSWKLKTLRNCVLGSVLCGVSAGVIAQVAGGEVGEPLKRSALMVSQAEKAVLLGAAVTGSGRIVAVGERGVVILSDDGGMHWRQASTPVSVTLTAVRFAGGQQGVAVGHGGVVLTSADGGESWQLRLDGQRAVLLAQEDAKASGNPRLLENVELMMAEGPDKPFLDVSLRASTARLVVGAYGLAFGSADVGKTWTSWMSRHGQPQGPASVCGTPAWPGHPHGRRTGLAAAFGRWWKTFRRLESPFEGSLFAAELLLRGRPSWPACGAAFCAVAMAAEAGRRSMPGSRPLSRVSCVGRTAPCMLVNQAGQILAMVVAARSAR